MTDSGHSLDDLTQDACQELKKVAFNGLSGSAVEVLEDGGFTATVIGGP